MFHILLCEETITISNLAQAADLAADLAADYCVFVQSDDIKPI